MATSLNLVSVLTVRNGSNRLPRKVMSDINGKPLFIWIAERLSTSSQVVVATTTNIEDDEIVAVATKFGYDVFRHDDVDDVMSRVYLAAKPYNPDYIFRALGDCSFIDMDVVTLAMNTIERFKADAFLWYLPPDVLPVYGTREFPYPTRVWETFMKHAVGEEREHTDMYFNRHRGDFNIVYHESLPKKFFRNYRLEVDYEEDVSVVRAIYNEIGNNPSVVDVITLLDDRPDIVLLNIDKTEKTGLFTSYSNRERRAWYKFMRRNDVVLNNGSVLPPSGDQQIFCSSGECYVGSAKDGVLVTIGGSRIKGEAYVQCDCGAGLFWHSRR